MDSRPMAEVPFENWGIPTSVPLLTGFIGVAQLKWY